MNKPNEAEQLPTYAELNDLRFLPWHIRQLSRRIAEIESRALPQSPKTDGMPRGGNTDGNTIERTVETAEKQIQALETLKVDYEQRRASTEMKIYAISNEYVKTILIARFINNYTWRRVAREIGGGNTAEGVRKACMRYLVNNSQNN